MTKLYSTIRHTETNGHFSVDFIDLDARDLIASYAGDSEGPTCPVMNTVNDDDATYPSAEDAHKAISDSLAAAGLNEFVPGPVGPAILAHMNMIKILSPWRNEIYPYDQTEWFRTLHNCSGNDSDRMIAKVILRGLGTGSKNRYYHVIFGGNKIFEGYTTSLKTAMSKVDKRLIEMGFKLLEQKHTNLL